jgi:hypothetical protein
VVSFLNDVPLLYRAAAAHASGVTEKLEARGDAATDRAGPALETALAAELARALPDRAA